MNKIKGKKTIEKKDMQLTLLSEILIFLRATNGAVSKILWSPYQWRNQILFGRNYDSTRKTLYYLIKKSLIKSGKQNKNTIFKLTKKGELQALIITAQIPAIGPWDGFWRMVVFDIPEELAAARNTVRILLKKNKFYKLQASVYINQFALNKEAVMYLKIINLMQYIRLIKILEMDDDTDLKFFYKL